MCFLIIFLLIFRVKGFYYVIFFLLFQINWVKHKVFQKYDKKNVAPSFHY